MIRTSRFIGSVLTLALMSTLTVSASVISEPPEEPLVLPSAFVLTNAPGESSTQAVQPGSASADGVDLLLAGTVLPAPQGHVEVVRSRTISEPVTLFLTGLGLLGIGLGASRGERR